MGIIIFLIEIIRNLLSIVLILFVEVKCCFFILYKFYSIFVFYVKVFFDYFCSFEKKFFLFIYVVLDGR